MRIIGTNNIIEVSPTTIMSRRDNFVGMIERLKMMKKAVAEDFDFN